MTAVVVMRFTPASAVKLGLEVSPDNTYRLSWIELAFRLTQASGQAELANPEIVERALSGYWLAQAAAKAALRRPDWREVAWACGLLVLLDRPQEISPEQACCFLECFFLSIFTQLERNRDWAARQVQPEHVSGWVCTLSCSELAELGQESDKRLAINTPDEGFSTILASALNLYLRWSGLVSAPEMAEDLAEPDELPIPAGVIE